MTEVNLPQREDDREGGSPTAIPVARPRPQAKSVLRIVLEIVLISTGVFLGLAGEQCRENAQHRELARESLQRFRSEIRTNRAAVAAVKDYHVTTMKAVEAYLAADNKKRAADNLELKGLQPVFFESTAWDLALATQSLVYIDSELAFALSRIYRLQKDYAGLTGGIMQALYLQPPGEDPEPFFRAVAVYYGDITLWEPRLLAAYDEILPQIERALGQ